MAIYHLSVTQIKRSKGHSAVAAAAYRAGEKLHDARLDQLQDYSRKQGVVLSEILAPDDAPDWTRNREELWNKAEAAERQYNGQPAREIRLALPDELTDEQRADLVFDYVNDVFVSNGMIADVSIHRPDRYGDERNHHAHVLLTMRELDGDTFARTKQRDWNKSELVEDWREKWEEYQNDALEDAGFDARVDHRTLEAQGIDRDPTRHLGKEASAMERDGIATRIGDENRAALLQDAELDRLRGELAQVDAEVKRQSLTYRQPEEPSKKGLRYVEWYAMQPAPPEDNPPSVPTVQTSQPEEAVSAFTNEWTQAYMAQEPPKQEKQPVMYFDDSEVHTARSEPPLSWEATQAAAQSNFEGDITRAFEQDIMEHGEVAESGLGRSWYDRTVTAFENLYYDTVDLYHDTIEQARDYWQQYVMDKDPEPGQDRDEPEPEIW